MIGLVVASIVALWLWRPDAFRIRAWGSGAAVRQSVPGPSVAGRSGPERCGGAAGGRLGTDVVLELLAAAVRAGAAVPRALDVVGRHLPGPEGDALVRVASRLLLGEPWPDAWEGAPTALAPVEQCLESSWARGASPLHMIETAIHESRVAARAAARTAGERLAVQIVMPVGLCLLPAFVLLGVVPVLVQMARSLA